MTIKSSSDIIFPSSSQSLCHASVRLALITSSPSRPISRGCQIIMYQLISPRPAPAVTPNVWLTRPLSQCHTGRRADISGPCVSWRQLGGSAQGPGAQKREISHHNIMYEGAGICMRETVDNNCPGLVSVSLNNCGAVSHYKWMN